MFGCRETLGGGGNGLTLLHWYKHALEDSKEQVRKFEGSFPSSDDASSDNDLKKKILKVLKMSIDVGFYEPLVSKSEDDHSIDLRLLQKARNTCVGNTTIYSLYGCGKGVGTATTTFSNANGGKMLEKELDVCIGGGTLTRIKQYLTQVAHYRIHTGNTRDQLRKDTNITTSEGYIESSSRTWMENVRQAKRLMNPKEVRGYMKSTKSNNNNTNIIHNLIPQTSPPPSPLPPPPVQRWCRRYEFVFEGAPNMDLVEALVLDIVKKGSMIAKMQSKLGLVEVSWSMLQSFRATEAFVEKVSIQFSGLRQGTLMEKVQTRLSIIRSMMFSMSGFTSEQVQKDIAAYYKMERLVDDALLCEKRVRATTKYSDGLMSLKVFVKPDEDGRFNVELSEVKAICEILNKHDAKAFTYHTSVPLLELKKNLDETDLPKLFAGLNAEAGDAKEDGELEKVELARLCNS
jgi:hypothetical protein